MFISIIHAVLLECDAKLNEFKCPGILWVDDVSAKDLLPTNAVLEARGLVLQTVTGPNATNISTHGIITPSWEPQPNCTGMQFGRGEFKTGRHGSRTMLLVVALQYAKKFGMCSMVLSNRQRAQLHPMLKVPMEYSIMNISKFVGPERCVQGPANQLSRQRQEYLHTVCQPVKTLKHIRLFDNTGKTLPSIHKELLDQFGSLLPVYDFPSHIPEYFNNSNVLVMHLRGGDVWSQRSFWLDHIQPPCSYYVAAFRNGPNNQPYKEAVIITEDNQNPCIRYVLETLPKGSVKMLHDVLTKEDGPSRLVHDVAVLLRAKHVCLSSSVLPLGTTFFNANLARLHIPFGGSENLWDYWAAFAWSELPLHYEQYLYGFPNFTNAKRYPKIQQYCEYEEARIMFRVINATPRE